MTPSLPGPAVVADTGFFKALADPRDSLHGAARAFLATFTGSLITTEAVVVETCFFLAPSQMHHWLSAVADGFVEVSGGGQEAHRRAAALALKYADLDPDYADLSLVHLAETSGVRKLLTVDVTDFGVLRVRSRQKFELVPWQRRR